ncbi:class F sortase [Ornithinimicrobium tianjinense]|uniref:Sortase family protein n=1 Tax=Ornithinimicrobium tianjinense TaxID=1195761 RepID=A0A917BRK1_9MICO|nr:class F sortase [Ornithinimicrobium tianjinense]GGF53804.1 hypothetical protein GCM10011366_22050 [Ornithinimicrobium tianjinense]
MGSTRGTARRPSRVNVVALAVTLACLVVAGWAVRGLLHERVPGSVDFGTSATVDDRDGATAEDGPTTTSAAALPRPGRSSAALQPAQERAVPVRLTVPSVGLEVAIDPVAITEDGQMEIPERPDRAGWYRYGPAPGSTSGSVVVAGHVDTTTGPGAFLALGRVEAGAEVVVELDDGTSTAYRIVGGESVAKTDLAVDEIFRRDGDPVLRLVTCAGDWSPRTGHYTDNLVVTAVPLG